MKKLIYLLSILSTFQNVHAQKSETTTDPSSIGFSVGYAIPMGSQYVDQNSIYAGQGSNLNGTKGVYGSYGSGVYLNGFYRRMFTTSIGCDLSVNYLDGKQSTAGENYPSQFYTYIDVRHSSAQALFLSPSLILQTTDTKLRPYAKAGLVVGTVKIKSSEVQTTVAGTVSEMRKEKKYTGGVPLGIKGSVGIEFSLATNTLFFTEVTFTSLSYYPDKGELTKYTQNGNDQLGSISTSERITIYKNSLGDPATGTPPTQPQPQLKIAFAMGSVALNAGLRIKLSKAKENDH